jgi:hypothetical protein
MRTQRSSNEKDTIFPAEGKVKTNAGKFGQDQPEELTQRRKAAKKSSPLCGFAPLRELVCSLTECWEARKMGV